MYSIRNVIAQEPNAIREFVLSALAVLVMTGVVHLTAEAVAGIGIVVSGGLGLFYVRPLTASKSGLSELSNGSTDVHSR